MQLAAAASAADLVTRGLWRAAASRLSTSPPPPAQASAVGQAVLRALDGSTVASLRSAVETAGFDLAQGEILPLPFLRYRFCELKYRGAVGRRQVHCTLIVKIIWILLKFC
jgi:hypothetical protein